MSGGSWDYVYNRVEEAAERLLSSKQAKRVIFGALVQKVADALHDIEWVDSCDFGKGDEDKAIDACLNFKVNDALKAYVEAAIDDLLGLVKELSK